MRSVICGIVLTLFFVFTGNVKAANDLDGKALFCISAHEWQEHPLYGLTFDNGILTRHHVDGYEIIRLRYSYSLKGTTRVKWGYNDYVDRVTLISNGDQCSISSIVEITQNLNYVIATAKKKNQF